MKSKHKKLFLDQQELSGNNPINVKFEDAFFLLVFCVP